MLTAAENLAIHLTFALAIPPAKAAHLAGANLPLVDQAIARLLPKLHGRTLSYDRFTTDCPAPEDDAFRLNKEIQLAQLQHMHDECIRSWNISAEHSARLAEYESRQPAPESGPPKKPYLGDIRFLQLAKHLRKEMQQIEKAIAAHIDDLHEKKHLPPQTAQPPASQPDAPARAPLSQPDTSARAPLSQPDALARAPLSQPDALARAEVQTDSVTLSPSLPTQATGHSPPSTPPSLPATTAARINTVKPLSPVEASLHSRREIPTISPPPRKKDKYAGVNR